MPVAPDVDPAEPWWMVTIKYAAWALVVIAVVWLVNRPMRQQLKANSVQLTNSHEKAEYPNLREELTAVRVSQDQMRATQDQSLASIQSQLGGIRSDAAKDREANHDDLLQAMTQQVPALIAQAVAVHTTACRRAK
jgi:hypothetical protein